MEGQSLAEMPRNSYSGCFCRNLPGAAVIPPEIVRHAKVREIGKHAATCWQMRETAADLYKILRALERCGDFAEVQT